MSGRSGLPTQDELWALHKSFCAAIAALVNRFPKSLSLIAGALSALGFAPLGWWPLTLLAFAFLLHLVIRAETLKASLARGYWFGVGHFIVGLNWIAGAFQYQEEMPVWLGWIAVVVLSLYIAVYPAMASGLAWRWGKEKPLVFVLFFAAAWIVTEWLRATMFTGFAWNPLSVAFVETAYISRWIGTYGLSGLVIALSGGMYLIVHRQWKAGGAIVVTILALFVGLTPLPITKSIADIDRERAQPVIRIIQPNIGQQDKYKLGYEEINFAKLARLTGKPGSEPRLILWPEAAIPDYLDEKSEEAAEARARIATLIGPKDAILTGGVKREFKSVRNDFYIERTLIGARNSVWGMLPDERLILRYDKSHLVPYGEYLPMKPFLSKIGVSRLVPGEIDFWPGPGPQSYAVPGFGNIGVQICYEIIFSGQVIDAANRPNFLFNPSNDAWFGAWGPPQHLAQGRLRAIEEGLPVIRATPTGISAVIDANGRVLASIPYHKSGYIQTRLPRAHAPTPFARYGNIIPLFFALLLTGIGVALRGKRR
jgi:apolipoprotein N-acyltransferase